MPRIASALICETCGKPFVTISDREQQRFRRCRDCHRAWQDERREQREKADDEQWQERKRRERAIYEEEVAACNPVRIEEIRPDDSTLYIIGNGFDLMHRVPSSYYDFGKSLGKNSGLRRALDIALHAGDIWADFEEALANQNLDIMGSREIVDMWLDDFGFYEEDSGGAEFYMAAEACANPIATIANKLQPAFRRWVDKLAIGTDDRPLESIIRPGGKVLCFNYTEFIEDLYQANDVCYIHGCRKNKGEKLILGHRPDAYCNGLTESYEEPQTYRQAVIEAAQDQALSLVAGLDGELTKDSRGIIRNHSAFFEALRGIDQVIVIGHAASPVDWDYYGAVNRMAPDARWFFGSYGLRDLRNIRDLAEAIGLRHLTIFRTDCITTKPLPGVPAKTRTRKPRVFSAGNLSATATGANLRIAQDDSTVLEMGLPSTVKNAVFFGGHLLVILGDLDRSVLLFSGDAGSWAFVDMLAPIENQGLINPRLRHVYVAESDITFVYNNRVRSYDLASGQLTSNKQVRGAKSMRYRGEDIFPEIANTRRGK